MKKRILSILLLFAMLVTMVPTMALGAAAEVDDDELPRSEAQITAPISDYYSLYKTDGLIAFFDALDPENGTLDLAEGKWYARVYNANTDKFEISETIYATVKGGAYDAEQNATGWQAYESGFGYADANLTAVENVIEFDKALLSYEREPVYVRYSNWTVETTVRVDLRDVADKDGRVENAFLFGPVGATHWTNLQSEDADGGKGAVRWSVTPKSGSSASPIYVTANGFTELQTSPTFHTYNGKVVSLSVSKSAVDANGLTSRYTVTHGDVVSTSRTDAQNVDYNDVGLHILKNEQGTVYTLRVYASEESEPLTAEELAVNNTVDNLIRLGVSLDVFNTMVEYEGLAERFLSEVAPTLAKDASKEDYEKVIAELVAREIEIASAKVLDKYEKLYVGTNGSLTENGGKLVSLFSVTDATLNITTGEWINKLGSENATLGNPQRWEKRADGTVGYTGLYGQLDEQGVLIPGNTTRETNTIGDNSGGREHFNTRLNLGLALLPDEDFTIEYAAKYNPIYVATADGEIATDDAGKPVEYYVKSGNNGVPAAYTKALDYIGFVSSWTAARDGAYYGLRGDVLWFLTDGTPHWDTAPWVGSKRFAKDGGLTTYGLREIGKMHTYAYTRDESLFVDEEDLRTVEAVYALLRDGANYVTSPVLSTANRTEADLDGDGMPSASEDWGKVYFDKADTGDFYLSSAIPTDFFKVRIYDKVLTEQEMAHNAFIDMAAYAGADLTLYNRIDDKEIAESVERGMLVIGFSSDPLTFAANLTNVIDLYANQRLAEDTLYVTDGLRILTAAYEGLDTGALVDEGVSVSWINAAREGEHITLKGKGWERRANNLGGGYYIFRQQVEMAVPSVREHDFGIYLTPDMLPEADYSLELVINPTGIVDFAEDGTYSRYKDDQTRYGLNYENGFMIGPLRCLIFPSDYVPTSDRAGLETRWVYAPKRYCWDDPTTRNHKVTDRSWCYTTLHEVITTSIDFQCPNEGIDGLYSFYHNYEQSVYFKVKDTEYITNEEADNAFQLLVGMPGGVFSVRLYHRLLTEAEKIQNHAADIIYYYNLNTDLLNQVLPYFEDDPTVVFRGLSELSFDLPREDAQKIFDARLSALWLGFDGFSVRNDYTDGLRYYFTLDETTATKMTNAGFQIEIGAILNVGQNADPVLDGYNYDYKVVAYDSVGGKNEGFFIDENTFAVTVKADSAGKNAMLTQLNARGYIRLTDADGKTMDFYVETDHKGSDLACFFNIYNYMMQDNGPVADAALRNHFEAVTDSCYENEYIYLQAGAPAGGNGTKDAPYSDFETAFAATKAKLPGVNKPTNLHLRAGDGVYEMRDVVSLDGLQLPYEYYRFVITSTNRKSTLTTTKKIDLGGFIEADSNVWTYQFAKDENGEYPSFRYLYVNGEIADLAHNGANSFYAADETRYMTQFLRWDVTPWLNAQYLWEAGALSYNTLYYPAEKVDLNSSFAYYRDQYLVYQDIYLLRGKLTPISQSPAKNPSTYFTQRFEEIKFQALVYTELSDLFNSEDVKQSKDKFLDALNGFSSKYTLESLLKGDKEKLDAAAAAYEAAMAQYAEGSPEYLAAVAAYEAATAAYLAAEATVTETLAKYKDFLKKATTSVLSAVKGGKTVTDALSAYMLKNPTAAYPARMSLPHKADVVKYWATEPSSGIYALVTSMYKAGTLTHASQPAIGDKGLASELQFLYYRDAYLALDEVNALDVLSFDAVPTETNGSDQYKALFYKFLYTKMAVAELEAVAEASGNKKSIVAGYVTAKENAPAEYAQILIEIRNAQVLANPFRFGNFSSHLPTVKEADAPYGGLIPSDMMMDQYKIYLNVELIGEQDVAIANGRAKLVETGTRLLNEAAAKYQAVYDKLVAAQTRYDALTGEEQQKYASQVDQARLVAKIAYESYLAEVELASRYLTDEYDESFVLEGAGLQLAAPMEWQHNIINITGVDYDDKIVKDGETHVAVYFDPTQYEKLALTYEYHMDNCMVSILSSSSYLDKNNEFYYDEEHGLLYYYNENGIDGLQFEYPTLDNMIYLSNFNNFIVDGMTFTGVDYAFIDENGYLASLFTNYLHIDLAGEESHAPSGAAIYGKMVANLQVRNSTFRELGGEGVSLRGRIENSIVEGCSFTNIGAAAVRFGDDAGWSDVLGAENCTITNNYFDGIARFLYNAAAVLVSYAKDFDISYNTIRNTSYSGISVGRKFSPGNFMYGEEIFLMHVDIHHNYVESVMQEMADGGHIYTCGGNASKYEHTLFNWNHDNYIVFTNKTGDGRGHTLCGLYHDGASSNWETYNNVVVSYSFGASGPTTPDGGGNIYLTPTEDIDEVFFETVDTEFTLEEYQLHLRKNRNFGQPFYQQDLDTSQAFNILLHDNYLINTRSTKTSGTERGTQFFEAFQDDVTAADFIYVENMTYVGDPAYLPVEAENIIYEAGCKGAKGDPMDIADNNY